MKEKQLFSELAEQSAEEAEPPASSGCVAGGLPQHFFEQNVSLDSLAAPIQKNTNRARPKLRFVPPQTAKFPINPKTNAFRKKFFSNVSFAEWSDWHWQLRNRIQTVSALSRIIRLTDDELDALTLHRASFPFAITPYYLSLLDADSAVQPLRRAIVPVSAEMRRSAGEADDPLAEDRDSPVPGLVHRYPDRVLFLTTDFCSTYCRYCTRSRMVGHGGDCKPSYDRWNQALKYIEATPAVRDVLLSGGDPLTLPNDRLEWLLARLSRIPHVEIIRIGSKVPVVMPQRITLALTRMLKRYHPLWLSIHFTHPDELTAEVHHACTRLADAGIPLGSQTVLLAGVNDDVDTMRRLFQGLLKIRVRPYYLYQCDPIPGSAHFRAPVAKGLEIIRGLRGFTSGYAIPSYVIDAPGGGGKIPLLPEYVVERDRDGLMLKNYEGKLYQYPETTEPAVLL
jgi:lysine 2,3-aminomutase